MDRFEVSRSQWLIEEKLRLLASYLSDPDKKYEECVEFLMTVLEECLDIGPLAKGDWAAFVDDAGEMMRRRKVGPYSVAEHRGVVNLISIKEADDRNRRLRLKSYPTI